MRRIQDRDQLRQLARELGVRPDWHEPDEKDVTARVEGRSFDNAGFWPTEDRPYSAPEIIEQHVVISRGGQDVAAVNLATLCAWAAEPDQLEEINQVLRTAGIEYPLGVSGVRDLVDQRDGEYQARQEVEAELVRLKTPDLETQTVLGERAERHWRRQLAIELRAYARGIEEGTEENSAAAVIGTTGARVMAAVLAEVLKDGANHISKEA